MFAVVVSGRQIITEFKTVSPNQIAFEIPSTPAFNYLVVFLLPNQLIPSDTAAAIYLQLGPISDWKLLGSLSNIKPSAIFRIRDGATKPAGVGAIEDDMMVDDSIPGISSGPITLGISIQPVAEVEELLAAQKVGQTDGTTALVRAPHVPAPVSTKVLAQRIIANAFNFLASFGSDVIPLKAFEEWWKKFERKVELDPTFLERNNQT